MSAFDCRRCGACCRSIGASDVQELQLLNRGDGVCRHLTADNLCAIYDKRPALCRVDESCPTAMQLAEWQRRNMTACNQLHLQVYGQPLVR